MSPSTATKMPTLRALSPPSSHSSSILDTESESETAYKGAGIYLVTSPSTPGNPETLFPGTTTSNTSNTSNTNTSHSPTTTTPTSNPWSYEKQLERLYKSPTAAGSLDIFKNSPWAQSSNSASQSQSDKEDSNSEDEDEIIPKPKAAAFTARISKTPVATRFISPPNELTPPPSPELKSERNRGVSPPASATFSINSGLPSNLSAAKLGSALSRAGSVFARNRQNPNSNSSTASSSPSHSPVRKHKQSKSFADFLGVQGTSAPVSFGLSAGFGSSGNGGNPSNGNKNKKANDDMAVRPQHIRRASTLSAITSTLGLRSPSKSTKLEVMDESDEFLGLDLDAELFPRGLPDRHSPASFDDLLANSERLFLRLHTAYKARVRELHDTTQKQDVEQQEFEDAVTRANHLKLQLTELSARNEDQETMIRSLSQELEGSQQRNMKSIRLLPRHSPVCSGSDAGSEHAERLFSNHATGFDADDSEGLSSRPESVFSSRPGSADGSTTNTISTMPTEDEPGHATHLPMTWGGMKQENEMLKGRIEELERIIQVTLGSLNDLGV